MKISINFILLALPLILLLSCSEPSKFKVSHSGALMEIMSGNIEGTISLKSLEHTENLYALGAVEDLQGEIQIFDGELIVTSVKDNVLHSSDSWDQEAALLVYASVDQWTEITVPGDIKTTKDLEAFVKSKADSEGIPKDKPFPFLVDGKVKTLDYHVIDWDVNDKDHTHAKHQNSGIKERLTDAPVTMLGFYSEAHKGIFTHHSTFMHIHFRSNEDVKGIAGHVDDFSLGSGMTLKLPKQ